MRFDTGTPCKSCPYRKDAPLARWHRKHFEDLLVCEAHPIGTVYACHGSAKLPEVTVCAGWLLDQKKRNFPSIALRMAMLDMSEEDYLAIEATHDDGLELYDSVHQMCEANLQRDNVLRDMGVITDEEE